MGHSPPPSAVYVRSFLCPFFTLIKPPHKSPEWSSLVSGPKAKSSSEIMNLKSFTVMYQREILNLNACPKRLDRQCNPIWKDSPNEYEEAGGDSELLWEHSESTIEKTYLRSHTCLRFLSSISAHTVTLLKMSRYHRGLSFGGGGRDLDFYLHPLLSGYTVLEEKSDLSQKQFLKSSATLSLS